MSEEKVRVTIYRFTGRQLFFTIPQRYCEECDLTIRLVNRIASEIGEDQVEVVVKPWFNYLPEALFRRAWHPPVVFVEGQRVSQGTVPDAEEVRQRIKAALDAKQRIHDSANAVREVKGS